MDLAVYNTLSFSGLFIPIFYLRRYPDVARDLADPLRHYLERGIDEGRWPNPLFDPHFYSAQCEASGLERPLNPLLHFIEVGAGRKLKPHRYFDPGFYVQTYSDVASENPLRHYIWYGGYEGRQPCAEFQPDEYYRRVPEARQPDQNPLLNALEHEQVELGNAARAQEFQRFRRPLKLFVDRIAIGDELSIEGWLFHENYNVRDVRVVVDKGTSRVSKRCRIGRPRADVFRDHTIETARNSGFSASGMEIGDHSRIALDITLETGSTMMVELADLKWSGTDWSFWPLTRSCKASLEQRPERLRDSPWRDLPFKAWRSLEKTLSLVAGSPPDPLPPLPESVAILISVYRGRQYLRPFFDSLFANTRSPCHVVIVDNGNDDRAIVQYLRAIAASHDNVTLVRVEENRGYVGAMCLAVEYATAGHIVVLNTDTVLPLGWLERLMWPIFDDPTIASTTPFTNAGTTCSFPRIGVDNPLFLGLEVDEIDRAVSCCDGQTLQIELPSGIGFCMGHNRRAVEQIGWYDFEAFGKGYGEENDWCLRAANAGFKNVMVPNLFVYHKHGGIYLSEEKRALLEKSLSIVNERYPRYHALVELFFEIDPIAPARSFIAFRLAARRFGTRPCLIVDHDIGGGSNLFRQQVVDELVAQGVPIILVTCEDSDPSLAVTIRVDELEHTFPRASWRDLEALVQAVGGLGRLVVNQLVNFTEPAAAIAALLRLAENYQPELIVYVHDFFYICPSYTLLDADGRFCDIPEPTVCAACSAKNQHFALGARDRASFTVEGWRADMLKLLRAASRIHCFSGDSARLMRKAFDLTDARIVVSPHFLEHFDLAPVAVDAAAPLHIGVVGAINEAKGAAIVLSLARAIRDTAAPVKLTVLGTIDADTDGLGITMSGRYAHERLGAEIEERGINLVLLPSIWPETFCLVADEIMSLDVPLAVFDIGAPAERVRLYPKGFVLPMCEGEALLERLQAFQRGPLPVSGLGVGDNESCGILIYGRRPRGMLAQPNGGSTGGDLGGDAEPDTAGQTVQPKATAAPGTFSRKGSKPGRLAAGKLGRRKPAFV